MQPSRIFFPCEASQSAYETLTFRDFDLESKDRISRSGVGNHDQILYSSILDNYPEKKPHPSSRGDSKTGIKRQNKYFS